MTTVRTLVLGGLLVAAAAAETLEDRIRLAEKAVEELEERRELADTLGRLDSQLERLEQEESDLQEELRTIRAEVASVRAAKRAAAVASRREAAVGSSVEVLETRGGDYRDVTILKVSDIGLHIRHASGVARVGFDELSGELQEKYGYDPELAQQQLEEEQERQRVMAEAMDAELAEAAEAEEKKRSATRASSAGGSAGATGNAVHVRPQGRLSCRVVNNGGNRSIEITVVSNCPAKITVRPTPNERGSRIFSVPGGDPVTRVVRLRRNGPHRVTLEAASGELLDTAG